MAARAIFDSIPAYSWRSDAACRGADHRLFMVADREDCPELAVNERLRITRRRFKEALAYCKRCPVRTQCGEDASPGDRKVSVRGGVAPEGDGNPQVTSEVGFAASRLRPVGRPARSFTRKPPEGYQDFVEAVKDLIEKGFSTAEGARELDLTDERYRSFRRTALDALTEDDPDAVIRAQYRNANGSMRPSNYNGPGWLISRSACGRVVLVATKTAAQIRLCAFRATQVNSVRTDAPVLERFPSNLVRGSRQ